jgi:predicted ester cyclase
MPMIATQTAARETVLSLLDALNAEKFDEARRLVHDNVRFEGPMAAREGAEAYFTDMRRIKLKYAVEKVFVEGDDVCLVYELGSDGKKIPCVGIYQVREGKVDSLQAIFDPRPLLKDAKS